MPTKINTLVKNLHIWYNLINDADNTSNLFAVDALRLNRKRWKEYG